MSLQEAADETPFHPRTLERAIRATDPYSFPPPLRAKKAGYARNSKIVILRPDLQAWLESFPDA